MLALLLACALSALRVDGSLSGYRSAEVSTGRLYWQGPATGRADWVKSELPLVLDRMEKKLGRKRSEPFTTIFVPHFAELRRIASHLGAREPASSTRGVALPHLNVILVLDGVEESGARADPVGATLAHEVAHLVLHRKAGADFPRWLDEGVAVWASGGGVPAAEETQFTLLARLSAIYRPETLDEVLTCGQSIASLAYCQSYLMVLYLVGLKGEAGLHRVLDRLEAGETMAAALEQTYSLTTSGFVDGFRRWAAHRHPLLLALLSAVSPWTLVSLLAVAAVLVSACRRRARVSCDEDVEPATDDPCQNGGPPAPRSEAELDGDRPVA
jgi:hypothetical protein